MVDWCALLLMSRTGNRKTSPNDEKSPPPPLWWECLEEECPITLEPLRSLPYPPFALNEKYLFDGVALASYMVSRGIFENPLTREVLTYPDCRRLDEYVRLYHGHDTRMAVCCEAFTLRNSIRVSGSAANETDSRRAQLLRNEAAAALCHLFVYEQHRNRSISRVMAAASKTPHQHATAQSLSLYESMPTRSAVEEMDGLRIMDDDEVHIEAVGQSERTKVQQSFPPLSSSTARPTAENIINVDQRILEHVRETAASSQREEELQRQCLQEARLQLMMEARARQEERRRAREAAKAAQRVVQHQQRQEKNELERARAEIEQWRQEHWDRMLEDSRRKSAQGENPSPSARLPPPSAIAKHTTVEAACDEEVQEMERATRKKQKAVAKRQRARERKTEQRREEQEQARTLQEMERLEQEKQKSAKKCASCGDGILGAGFEKFGYLYCSPSCARRGDTTTTTITTTEKTKSR